MAGVGAAYALANTAAAVVMLRLVQRGGAGFQPSWRATAAWGMFRRIPQVGAVASGLAFGAFGLGMAMSFAAMGAQRMGAAVLAGCDMRGRRTGAQPFWTTG